MSYSLYITVIQSKAYSNIIMSVHYKNDVSPLRELVYYTCRSIHVLWFEFEFKFFEGNLYNMQLLKYTPSIVLHHD